MCKFFLKLFIVLLPFAVAAQQNSSPDSTRVLPCKILAEGQNRKSVGVVLEGGVALGLAHVGVLRWLEEERIPVDCIAGTSMGGLIGALYSMGYSPRTVDKIQQECEAQKNECDTKMEQCKKEQRECKKEEAECSEKTRIACPKSMESFLQDLLDNDRWASVFFDLLDYGDLSFARKNDRRSYPNSFRFRLDRSIHLPSGIVPGHRVGLVFDDLARPYSRLESFDALPIPFRCVATDLKTRRSDVLGTDVFAANVGAEGRLSGSLRATMSLPVYFSPEEVNVNAKERRSYADGGLLRNLPTNALNDMGADIIIAVHLNEAGKSPTCDESKSLAAEAKTNSERSLLDVLSDTLSVVTSTNEQKSIKHLAVQPNGLCINVDVSGIGGQDFGRWKELIDRGYHGPHQTPGFEDVVFSNARNLRLNDAEYLKYRIAKSRRNEAETQASPSSVTVTIDTNLAPSPDTKDQDKDQKLKDWVRRSLSCKEPDQNQYQCPWYVANPFTEKDAEKLKKRLNKVVGTGRMSRLGYHVLTKPKTTNVASDTANATDTTNVAIIAQLADQTGAEVQPIIAVDGSDYQTPVFALGLRFTAFDRWLRGSEWRGEAVIGSRYGVNTEYQLPVLSAVSHWFVALRGVAESAPYNIYHDQDEQARFQLRTISGAFDMGYNFGSMAQLRAGYEGGGAKLSQKLGATVFPFTSGRIGTTSLKFSLDLLKFSLTKLEAPVVPHNGIAFNSTLQWHDAWLGASDHFPSAAAELEAFKSVSRNVSFYVRADGGSALGYANNGLPLFSLGSPLHLAAYGTNELRTNQYLHGSAGYVHRVYQFQSLGGAVYVTGSVEIAKVYGLPGAPVLPKDAVAGVILNSIAGPLFVGGTVGDASHRKIFFYMGKIF